MNETNQIKNISNVMEVYSGVAHACRCGCAGTYKVATAHRAAADADRGYPHDDGDISDRSVKLIVNKINKAIASGVVPDVDPAYVSVDVGTRTYTAYFVPVVPALDYQI
jgi:hypothetical protein